MVWDRKDNVLEAEKQLSDPNVYRDVSNSENILTKLSKWGKKMVSSLRKKNFITKTTSSTYKYFTTF